MSKASKRDIRFVASPWSAPAWMKNNHDMRNSDMPGLIQDDRVFQAWAMYLSKYISAMKAQGIPIYGLTVQNEPHVAKQFLVTYECMGFNATHERNFLRDYLGPRMRADHPEVQLFVHDDQKPEIVDYVSTILDDPQAAPFVDGVAYHWYGGFLKNYDFLAQLHNKYPHVPMLATEATLEAHWKQTDPYKQGQYYAIDIIGDLQVRGCHSLRLRLESTHAQGGAELGYWLDRVESAVDPGRWPAARSWAV
jgi:glucosylceramidase